jgi:hypothetical protein
MPTADARTVYAEAVRPLPPDERLRVAALILEELTQPVNRQSSAATKATRLPRGPERDTILRDQAEAAMRDPGFVADMRETTAAFAIADADDWPAYDGPEPEPFFADPADEARDIAARHARP